MGEYWLEAFLGSEMSIVMSFPLTSECELWYVRFRVEIAYVTIVFHVTP